MVIVQFLRGKNQGGKRGTRESKPSDKRGRDANSIITKRGEMAMSASRSVGI
jgi:hypothetical protein